MFGLLLLAAHLLLAATNPRATSPAERSWEKMFEVNERGSWLTSVWAKTDTEWYSGGKGYVVRGHGGTIERDAFPGNIIMELGPKNADLPLALGTDQLIARFDGRKWIREHEGRSSPQRDTTMSYVDDLYAANYLDDLSTAPLVAFGRHSILTRQSDGTWIVPPQPERNRLRNLALLGPKSRTPGCAGAGWLWLGRALGWSVCRDRRAFLFEAGKVTGLGKVPNGCYFKISASTFAGGQVYASCGSHGLWRSRGGPDGWISVPAPKGVRSIAVTPRCIFVATMYAVWRRCAAGS